MDTVTFDMALSLRYKIEFQNAEMYYFTRTKEKFYGKDLPKLAKDFKKLYVPAPSLLNIVNPLPKIIKHQKKNYNLVMWYDEAELFCIGYCLEHFIDETIYEFHSDVPADAAASLILKLKKDGKLKI